MNPGLRLTIVGAAGLSCIAAWLLTSNEKEVSPRSFGSSLAAGHEYRIPANAFDEYPGTDFVTDSEDGVAFAGLEYPHPIRLRFIRHSNSTNSLPIYRVTAGRAEWSDDGQEWHSGSEEAISDQGELALRVSENKPHRFWRFLVTASGPDKLVVIGDLDFEPSVTFPELFKQLLLWSGVVLIAATLILLVIRIRRISLELDRAQRRESSFEVHSSSISGRRLLAYLFTLCFLVVLVTEILARVSYRFWFSPGQQPLFEQLISGELASSGYFTTYRPHPYSAFTLREGTKLVSGEKIHTEHGIRAPDIVLEKPSGNFRIVLLGGSSTYNNGLPFLQTFAAHLEELLERSFPNREIDVINVGIGGGTSAESFARFHFIALDFDPDMVVIYHGINDVWPRIYAQILHNDFRGVRQIMTAPRLPSAFEIAVMRYVYFYRAIYWVLDLNARVPSLYDLIYHRDSKSLTEALRSNPPTAFERNLEDIIYISKARGIEPVLVTMALDPNLSPPGELTDVVVEGTKQHNELQKRLAVEDNVALIDLDATMPRTHGLFGDIVHLTPLGQRTKAWKVMAGLIPIMETMFATKSVTLSPESEPVDPNRLAIVHRRSNGVVSRVTQASLIK